MRSARPAYMAPEQARGEKHIDARADVFALGVILYRLFTGSLPFDADTPVAMMLQAASGDIAPISSMRRHLPEGLVRIVAKCLEHLPSDRYNNARDLLADLHAFRQGQNVKARRIGRLYSLQRWSRAQSGAGRSQLWRPSSWSPPLPGRRCGAGSKANVNWPARRNLISSAERIRSDWYIDQMRPVHNQVGNARTGAEYP